MGQLSQADFNYGRCGLLSAHEATTNIPLFFTRLILSTLETKRETLLEDASHHHVSDESKAKTLVVEWSGANDLITANATMTEQIAEKAVMARIENIAKLAKNGYDHFVLFNLPDLSLTPRYQKKSLEERERAKQCSDFFNQQLLQKCAEYKAQNPGISIEVFDVNGVFRDIHAHPGDYNLHRYKLTTPFVGSVDDHGITKEQTAPSTGYMFWDDVHPTADVHAILAQKFYEEYNKKYNFQQTPARDMTEKSLVDAFKKKHQEKYTENRMGCFGLFRNSRLYEDGNFIQDLSLKKILELSKKNDGRNRTYEIMTELKWINHVGLDPRIIALVRNPPQGQNSEEHSLKP